jgi:hypothetical protein
MLPDLPPKDIEGVGNAAGAGAILTLFDERFANQHTRIFKIHSLTPSPFPKMAGHLFAWPVEFFKRLNICGFRCSVEADSVSDGFRVRGRGRYFILLILLVLVLVLGCLPIIHLK